MTRRQRGTGRIFLPKGSSVWWLQYYQNGVKQRESAQTSDRRLALEKLKLRIAEVTTGAVTGLTPKKTRISELADDFIRDYRINGKTSLDDATTRWKTSFGTVLWKVESFSGHKHSAQQVRRQATTGRRSERNNQSRVSRTQEDVQPWSPGHSSKNLLCSAFSKAHRKQCSPGIS